MATVESKSNKLYLSIPKKPPKVLLKSINPHITCNLCKGYLIDATTIVECLHSFCHSCIMMHLRCKTYCPSCEMLINKVKPNIKPDATLQAIVYKLVPGLYEKELLRRRAFYKLRKEEAQLATPEQRGDDTEHLIFGPNENISLMLEYSDNDHTNKTSDDEHSDSGSDVKSSHHSEDEVDSQLKCPKYLQCPAIFRIANLKKFVLHKFGIDPNKFCVEIMYKVKTIALPDYYTLMDVAYIYTWKRDAPMKFFYCVRAKTDKDDEVLNVDQLLPAPPSYVNAKRNFLNELIADHDQSSDVDSDSGTSASIANTDTSTNTVPAPTTNGLISQESEISAITTITTITTATTIGTPTTAATTATTATVVASATTTNRVNRSSPSTTGSFKNNNGKDINRANTNSPQSHIENENSATLDARLTSETNERISANQSNGTKTNTEKRNNGSNNAVNIGSASPQRGSPSKSNIDVDKSKEKVKIKIGSNTTSETSSKTASPTRSLNIPEEKTSGNDSDKGKSKFTPNKEKDTKSKSPTNPESEYDFDQHLLEVKMSEKNQFLNSFNLKPSASTESQQLKSTKNETKADLTSDTAAKENKTLSPSTSTSRKDTQSVDQISSDSTIEASNSPVNDPKRLESKASKRKSREPVKNIMKAKCVTPNIENELKWQTNSPNNGQSPLTLSRSSPINLVNERTESTPSTASTSKINMQMIDMWSQQNKNHLNSKHQRTSGLFKVPESKELHKTETETSIIINNVQRPNQVDTPRPPMLIDPDISSRIFPMGLPNIRKHHLFNETEIKEIGHDDARKVKVYGPSMSTTPLSNPMRTGKFPAFMQKLNKPSELPKSMKIYKQPLDNLNLLKKPKPRPSSSNPIDLKKLNSTGELEVTSSTINKGNITPKRPAPEDDLPRNEQKNVQKFLESANISIPKYLEVTLTNDDNDTSRTQSTFSQNKTPVNNYIEILKLPDELTSNSPNQERSRSSSPVVINLVSNKPSTSTPLQNVSKTFATPSTSLSIPRPNSGTEFQEKFLDSFRREKAAKARKKLPKTFNSLMLGHKSPYSTEPLSLLPQKRKQLNTIPKRFPRSPAECLAPNPISSPVEMGFPDIAHFAHQNNSKKYMQLPAMSPKALLAAIQSQIQQQRQGLNNRDNSSGSGANMRSSSSSDITSGSGSGQKTDYLPIPTSSKPYWSEYFTPAQKAEHESLMERLKKN